MLYERTIRCFTLSLLLYLSLSVPLHLWWCGRKEETSGKQHIVFNIGGATGNPCLLCVLWIVAYIEHSAGGLHVQNMRAIHKCVVVCNAVWFSSEAIRGKCRYTNNRRLRNAFYLSGVNPAMKCIDSGQKTIFAIFRSTQQLRSIENTCNALLSSMTPGACACTLHSNDERTPQQ